MGKQFFYCCLPFQRTDASSPMINYYNNNVIFYYTNSDDSTTLQERWHGETKIMTTPWPIKKTRNIKLTYNYTTYDLKTDGYCARFCLSFRNYKWLPKPNNFVELKVEKACYLCSFKSKAKRVINKEKTKEHSGIVFSFSLLFSYYKLFIEPLEK